MSHPVGRCARLAGKDLALLSFPSVFRLMLSGLDPGVFSRTGHIFFSPFTVYVFAAQLSAPPTNTSVLGYPQSGSGGHDPP